ncbi:ankyrin repeat-containing domain protein [Nemania sp. FL0916]|nr:ankyrin repeat-containing domain protein [Nemania sp. FL0916]
MDTNTESKDLSSDIELEYELVFRSIKPEENQISVIRLWLQPTDYLSPGNEFMKHLHSHVPGTSTWFCQSPQFQTWTTLGKPNCLAIRGVAGSGKSVLAASTIHQLQEAEPDVPVLFFFFRQIVEKNHSARYLIRDFASQLLPYSQSLSTRLDVLRQSGQVDGNEHSSLFGALEESVHRMEKVYLVVDALDEMDDQDFAIIERLAQLASRESSRAKLLFTTRPVPRIEETLRALQVPHVRLDPALASPDVAKYVTVSMGTLDPMLSPEKEDEVKQAICERAQGLFLHARLMTDTLTEGLKTGRVTEKTLPCSLDQLPHNLKDVYESMLQEHSKRSGVTTEQQARILGCVTHASRPLRLIELGSLVARMIGSGDLKEGKSLVRASCGRLLEILDDETVSIIHHSFTEFLRDETRASVAGSFPVLDESTAHAMLAVLSLQYLDQCPLLEARSDNPDANVEEDPRWFYQELGRRTQMLQDLALSHPLLPYAIANLSHHIHKVGDGCSDIMNVLGAILVPGKPAFSIWVYHNWRSRQSSTLNAVHVASLEDWPAYVEHMCVNYPTLIDIPDVRGRSPLSYAAEEGHSLVARHLMNHGALPGSYDEAGRTPMHYAASNGHADIVRLLVAAGISPLIQKTEGTREFGEEGQTALQDALERGHVNILSIFLPLVPASEADRCLHWANSADLLETILKTGNAHVDSHRGGVTRLFQAAECHDLETIEVLLRYGADPNRRCDAYMWNDDDGIITQTLDCPGGPTAIHAFAGCLKMEIVNCDEDIEKARRCLETLVSHGAQVNARAYDVTAPQWQRHREDHEGDFTALHYAVRKQTYDDGFTKWARGRTQENLANLLLDAGADPNAKSTLGRNCIHFASPEEPGLIDVLVRGGADVNAIDIHGHSPLLALLSAGALRDVKLDVQALTKLIENGADISLRSDKGNSVLHLVFMNLNKFKTDDIPFLLSLIGSGEDFNTTNTAGLVPLFVYKILKYEFLQGSDKKILEAMIQKGMDINVRDSRGETFLWKIITSNNATPDIIEEFVRLGASLTLRNVHGRTLLHHAVKNRLDIGSVACLVKSGVDPTIQDDHGHTPVHLAVSAFSSHPYDGMKYIQALVQLGVSPTATTVSGATLLHFASFNDAAWGPDYWIDLILREPMFGLSDLNVTTESGVTPIHHAVSISRFTVRRLLRLGADPTRMTAEGLSPLHIACAADRPDIVCLLLAWYKDHGVLDQFVNQTAEDGSGSTPLHYSCRSGYQDSAIYLLAHGADPSRRDANNQTPARVLAEWQLGRRVPEPRLNPTSLNTLAKSFEQFGLIFDPDKYVQFLAGTQIYPGDHSDLLIEFLGTDEANAPLHSLVLGELFWQVEALEYAVSHGADVSTLNERGETLLQSAIDARPTVGFWKEAIIRILLEHGSDPNRRVVIHDKSERSYLEMSQDAEVTELLLRYGADVSQSPDALHYAITERMDPTMVMLLLKSGANANALSTGGRYPLHNAAHPKEGTVDQSWISRQHAVMEALVEYGADPLKLYDDGRPILQACIEEHGFVIPLLKATGLNLQFNGFEGRTALISACMPSSPPPQYPHRPENRRRCPRPEIAFALLQHGADVDALDGKGRSALHWLCTSEDEPFSIIHKDLLTAMVTAKHSIIHVADHAGYKPLHLAAQSGQTSTVLYLIENGADPNAADTDGNTVLHHFAPRLVNKKSTTAEAVVTFRSLLEKGLDLNARNHRGETPLHAFMATGWNSADQWSDEVIWTGRNTSTRHQRDLSELVGHDDAGLWGMFNEFGADWSARDNEGAGLLHVLAARKVASDWERRQQGDIEKTFRKLMNEVGLDPRLEDTKLRTPIDLAVARGNTGVVALFADERGEGKSPGGGRKRMKLWRD